VSVAYAFTMSHDANVASRISAYINERLGPRQPEGGIFHAEGPSPMGGWWSFNVRGSDESFSAFFETFVVPAAGHVGIETRTYERLGVAWDTSQIPSEPPA
jgi:hypothetical protein